MESAAAVADVGTPGSSEILGSATSGLAGRVPGNGRPGTRATVGPALRASVPPFRDAIASQLFDLESTTAQSAGHPRKISVRGGEAEGPEKKKPEKDHGSASATAPTEQVLPGIQLPLADGQVLRAGSTLSVPSGLEKANKAGRSAAISTLYGGEIGASSERATFPGLISAGDKSTELAFTGARPEEGEAVGSLSQSNSSAHNFPRRDGGPDALVSSAQTKVADISPFFSAQPELVDRSTKVRGIAKPGAEQAESNASKPLNGSPLDELSSKPLSMRQSEEPSTQIFASQNLSSVNSGEPMKRKTAERGGLAAYPHSDSDLSSCLTLKDVSESSERLLSARKAAPFNETHEEESLAAPSGETEAPLPGVSLEASGVGSPQPRPSVRKAEGEAGGEREASNGISAASLSAHVTDPHDPAAIHLGGPQEARYGADRAESAPPVSSGGREIFGSLDSGAVSSAHLLRAGQHLVEVGVNDPAHGWIEIRAEGVSGAVRASLITASAESHSALHTQLSGMADFLAERDVGVHSLGMGVSAAFEHRANPGNDHGSADDAYRGSTAGSSADESKNSGSGAAGNGGRTDRSPMELSSFSSAEIQPIENARMVTANGPPGHLISVRA